jgi:hypothetical protein
VRTVARDEICQIFLGYFYIIFYSHVQRPAGNQNGINSNIKQSLLPSAYVLALHEETHCKYSFIGRFYGI